jgi:ethanolamine utilization protein EutQ (cupin superfamily)
VTARTSTTALRVSKFTVDDATDWMEYSGMSLADVANEDDSPDMKLGAIGFTRAPAGATSEFDFPYDEALIVTRGSCTITSADTALSVRPGEVVYLPAGVAGTFHVDEAVELVYVASPPYGAVNRDVKAELLGQPSKATLAGRGARR